MIRVWVRVRFGISFRVIVITSSFTKFSWPGDSEVIFWFRSSVFEYKDLSLGWKVDKNFDQRVMDTDTAKQQHF